MVYGPGHPPGAAGVKAVVTSLLVQLGAIARPSPQRFGGAVA